MQDTVSVFNSKLFLKHWSARRENFTFASMLKNHLSMLKECDALKLPRIVRDNASDLANHDPAAIEIGFELSSEHENPFYGTLRMTKQ